MKTSMFNKKLPRTILLSSLVLAFAGFFAVGYSAAYQAPATPVVDPQTANVYFKNYYRQARAINTALKGFTIDMAQYTAMQQIAQQVTGVTGFRVYFGRDSNGPVGLVVGVSESGTELNTMIISTLAKQLEPCPQYCDEASSITMD